MTVCQIYIVKQKYVNKDNNRAVLMMLDPFVSATTFSPRYIMLTDILPTIHFANRNFAYHTFWPSYILLPTKIKPAKKFFVLVWSENHIKNWSTWNEGVKMATFPLMEKYGRIFHKEWIPIGIKKPQLFNLKLLKRFQKYQVSKFHHFPFESHFRLSCVKDNPQSIGCSK